MSEVHTMLQALRMSRKYGFRLLAQFIFGINYQLSVVGRGSNPAVWIFLFLYIYSFILQSFYVLQPERKKKRKLISQTDYQELRVCLGFLWENMKT